ncbi:hypothetical protein F3Y22_tig00110114pilonHSYRG00119 [Hibiscus syriacus]|uniref:Protein DETOXIFICATION n=1 Tax=Hibiscus syriacus TaxID=106335 RepID=A0A6A3BM56_HIBSY|nr:hypothetical protein F3Y22_tig00110114pilonHSYRG00119 [Hibiscus syriacus]
MEESLIPKLEKDEKINRRSITWAAVVEETKRVGYLAGPMVAVTISQYLLQVVSKMMVGHLGELALSSSNIAISLAGVTGFSFLLGMACALETLCGQSYGAQQLLVFIGQDPLISHEAGKFVRWLIPALFAYAAFQPLVRYFQTQSLITPFLICSCISLLVHIPLCWALVFKFGLESIGGSLAFSISNWLNVIFLALYMWHSPTCTKTRVPVMMELFQGITEFFRFVIPSAVMICLEWWSFELLILLSGLLPNPQLETSVLSVCFNTISTLYAIPYGLGAAASNDKEVVDYVTAMAPLVCVSVILDSLQGVLTGVARGCGWQHIGAYVNLAAFYLVGIPVAATLAFWLRLKGVGLWAGIQSGSLTQTILLAIVIVTPQTRSVNGSGRVNGRVGSTGKWVVTGQTGSKPVSSVHSPAAARVTHRFKILNGGELDFDLAESLTDPPPHTPPSTEIEDDTGGLGTAQGTRWCGRCRKRSNDRR